MVRILIADDDETFRSATADLLGLAGYHCGCVPDAGKAAAELAANSYDLLIADIGMPGNERLELLHALQAHPSPVPVMIVTGDPSLHTAIEALQLSVVDYVSKPLDFPSVLPRIRQAIEKGRALRALREVRQETSDWVTTVQRLETHLKGSPAVEGETRSRAVWPVDQYLDQMTAHLATLAINFKTTVDALKVGAGRQGRESADAPPDVCVLLRCPRRAEYRQAIRDTIDVLQKTKNAFRSRELGELRKRLETLLEREDPRGT